MAAELPPISTRTLVLLVVIVLGGLALRSAFSYRIVITPDRINLQDNDAWYHMRLIDNITPNWPARVRHDPFVLPGGQGIPVAPMFDFIVATTARLVGLGHPGQRTIELVAVWTPAVMGALIAPFVFLATRRLAGLDAALMAAALAAIMPGHLLERSRLGYVDHHALEALLATVVFWLTVRALQADETRRRAIGAAAMGAALALYLLSWASGSFLVSILAAWLAVQTLIDASRGQLSVAPSQIAFIGAIVALPIVWLLQARMYQFQFQLISLAGLAIAALAIDAVRRILARAHISPRWLPIAVAAGGTLTWFAAVWLAPSYASGFAAEIDRLRPDPTAFTVVEAMPLATFASLPWARVSPFMVLGTGLPLGAIGFVLVGAATIRKPRADWILLIVWTAIALAATLLRNRFGYYLVPMLAIMGGWVCAWFLNLVSTRGVRRDVIAAAIGALAFAPNLWPARSQVTVDAGVSGDWVSALSWLKAYTPPPFEDQQFYYRNYDAAQRVQLPRYSIMAWWDYGYWITRAAQRVPVANPTQAGAAYAGDFYSETDPVRAARLLDQTNARFIVVDYQLPLRIVAPPVYVMGKFETIVTWGARHTNDYYEALYVKGDRGELLPALVFYPAYYQAMANRLYHFGARAITPTTASVMTYADKIAQDGRRYREVTAMQTFQSYEQAAAYLRSLGAGPHRLVGLQPDQSPVPLEALPDYKLVWSSQGSAGGSRPAIQIFERFPTHSE